MSSDIAISIKGVSKCYQIYSRPNDRLKQSLYPRVQRALGRQPSQYFQEFWALRDVTYEIKKGSTVGIIGRNGSGKSTLLQLICGTLSPTQGSIETKGRIAALLELGSGFNPEFTGRENVFMNAAVLGLTRDETIARFDRIAAFADIGDFIDQPVKTYSTGMYVRLAFAVIAHVDADILVIDEALAVGDAVFTQKCMRYIREFQKRGTLLFVSHDTAAVQNLCSTALWLRDGQIEKSGLSKEVAEAYLQYTLQEIYGDAAKLQSATPAERMHKLRGDAALSTPPLIDYNAEMQTIDNIDGANGWNTGSATVLSVSLESMTAGFLGAFKGGEHVRMRIRAKANTELSNPILGFLFRDRLGQDLFGENTLPFTDANPTIVPSGKEFDGVFEFQLPMLPNGQYVVMASVANGTLYDHIQHHWLHDALIVNVSSSTVRFGLVGLAFNQVRLQVLHG